MKNKKLKLLEETILYYSENPLRRCRETFDGESQCFYDGSRNSLAESDGCAVGRLLPQELKIHLDDNYTFNQLCAGVDDIFDLLPDDIKAYGLTFLSDLQVLHDNSDYWDENGLTETGKACASRIKTEIENNLI